MDADPRERFSGNPLNPAGLPNGEVDYRLVHRHHREFLVEPPAELPEVREIVSGQIER